MSQIELAPQNLCDPTRPIQGVRFTCRGKANGKTLFECNGAMHPDGYTYIPCWCPCHGPAVRQEMERKRKEAEAPPPKTVTASELHEVQTALDLAIEDRDAAVRERDLLRVVAQRAKWLAESGDCPEPVTIYSARSWRAGIRHALKQLREALDAWGEDETKGGGR